MLFSGLCVTASKSELPKADRELISSIVSAYGGIWREEHFYDVNVFVTTSISNSKLNKYINTPGREAVCVAPQWISDSWRLQKLLPKASYQFLLGQGRPPCFAGKSISGSPLSSPKRERIAMSPPGPGQNKTLFVGKSVLLARDVCRASEQQLRSLEHFIKLSGGSVRRAPTEINGIAQAVRNSDYVVCRYREVQEFREAIRQSKQVGNLAWLIWVVSNDTFSDPREEPLHFPVPQEGIPEFKHTSITISNYRGASRQYLTKMIKLMGANFSGTLTARTSLCVAANLASEKTDKAKEWKIPIVNHKYIVDSFLAWAPVERAKLRYIDFPEGVDYNVDVGETRVTDESLGPWIDDAVNNDEPEDMPTSDPISPTEAPLAAPSTAADRVAVEEVKVREAEPLAQEAGDVSVAFSAHAGGSDCPGTSPPATPALQQSAIEHHDGSTTMSASSDMPSSPGPSAHPINTAGFSPTKSPLSQRGAKRGRLSILQDSVRQPTLDDVEARDEEEATEKTTAAPTKRAKIAASHRNSKQRSSSPAQDDNQADVSSEAPLRVATSNYKLRKTEEAKLKNLGIDLVDDIEIADVLVTPKVSRSPKMLYAIASGNVAIVSPDWLQACLKKRECIAVGSRVGASPYDLVDREGEKTYGISLAEVLQRRRHEFTQGIYHGHKFWLSRGVDENGSFSTLIEAAGGQVLPVPFDEAKLLSEPEHYHLIVGEDHTIEWRDLVGMPTVTGEPLKLYKKQLITDCIFEQQPRWDRHLVDTVKAAGGDSGNNTPNKRGRGAATGRRVYGR